MSSPDVALPKRIGYLALLRSEKKYRDLMVANLISLLGDWLDLIALTELVVNLAKQPSSTLSSTAALAAIMVARFLPNVIFGPLAGTLADRFPRHQVMIWANIGATVMVLCILPFLTPEGIPVVIALTFFKMGTQAIYMPANSAAVPMLIAEEHLQEANALSATFWSVMLAVGAVAGAAVVQWVGPQIALVIDAMTFMVANIFLMRLDLPAATHSGRGGGSDFKSGIRFLWKNRQLTGPLWVKTILGMSGGAILYPLLAEHAWPRLKPDGTLDISFVTGILYFAFGLGTLIGPLLMRYFGQASVSQMMRRLAAALFFTGGFGILFPMASNLAWAFAGVMLSSMARSVLWVYSATLLQKLSPNSFRGRVFACEFGLMTLGTTISILVSKELIERDILDARGLGVALGAFALAGGLPYLLFLLPNAKIPEPAVLDA